jgi:hypothetical protein
MTTKQNPFKSHGFPTDVHYLEAAAAHVVAKAARIAAEARWEPRETGHTDTVGKQPSTYSKETDRRIVVLRAAEEQAKQELDAGLAVTQSAGIILGIDRVTKHYSLTEQERTTLLLATLAALAEELETAICSIGPASFGPQLAPEVVWVFMEYDFEQQVVEGRKAFLPTGSLLVHDLISLTIGRTATPSSVRSATIMVTQKGFDAVVGITDDGLSGRKP